VNCQSASAHSVSIEIYGDVAQFPCDSAAFLLLTLRLSTHTRLTRIRWELCRWLHASNNITALPCVNSTRKQADAPPVGLSASLQSHLIHTSSIITLLRHSHYLSRHGLSRCWKCCHSQRHRLILFYKRLENVWTFLESFDSLLYYYLLWNSGEYWVVTRNNRTLGRWRPSWGDTRDAPVSLRNRRWGGSAYVLQMLFLFFLFFLFFFVFFSSAKNMRQPFSGTAGRIFVKLLPNDTWENRVCNVVPPPGEWRMLMICVIYAMSLAQSPEGATHGGCVIKSWAGECI